MSLELHCAHRRSRAVHPRAPFACSQTSTRVSSSGLFLRHHKKPPFMGGVQERKNKASLCGEDDSRVSLELHCAHRRSRAVHPRAPFACSQTSTRVSSSGLFLRHHKKPPFMGGFLWCPGEDSNFHWLSQHAPEACASTNSATRAWAFLSRNYINLNSLLVKKLI